MFVCCKAAEEAANACGAVLCPENRPSPIFVIFNFVMNIITAVLCIVNLTATKDSPIGCNSGKMGTWNIIMIVIAGVNMCFSVYLYMRFVSKLKEGHGAFESATKILLYDFGVYFYIWFSVFNIVWMVMGGNWADGALICDGISNTAGPVTCQAIYLAGGVFVVWLSLVTECCKEPRHMQQGAPTPPQHQSMGSNYAPVQQQARPAQPAYSPVAQPVQGQPVYHQQGGAAPPPMNPAYQQPQHQQQPQYHQQPQQNAAQKAIAHIFK